MSKPTIVFEDADGQPSPNFIAAEDRPENSDTLIHVQDTIQGRPVTRVMGKGRKHPDDEVWEGEAERQRIAMAGTGFNMRKNNPEGYAESRRKSLPGQPLPAENEQRNLGTSAMQQRQKKAQEKAVAAHEEAMTWSSEDDEIEEPSPYQPWHSGLRRPPQENSEIIDGLTSAGIPYGGENYLYIRPFEWSDLELLARAAEQDNVDLVLKAIDRTIDIPVYQLAIPDLYQVMYWQRINSYREMQYFMPWRCDEPAPTEENAGALCDAENHTPLGRTNLSVTHLDELGFESMPEGLDWPRAYLLPEMLALQRQATYREALVVAEQALRNVELTADDRRAANAEYLLIKNRMDRSSQYLKNVKRTPDILSPDLVEVLKWVKVGTTLREKRDFMRSQKSLALYQKAQLMERRFTFGIHEMANVTCEKCGASRGFRIRVDVTTFLS